MSSSRSTNKTYTEEDLQRALKNIRDRKKSIRQICLEYGIPKTTILDKLSGRRPDGIRKPGPEPGIGVQREKNIVQWLCSISKCGFPINKEECLDTAQKIIRDGKIKNKFKCDRPGNKWFERFLSRNKETLPAEDANTAGDEDEEEALEIWYNQLEDYIQSMETNNMLKDPRRVLILDEVEFALCPTTGNVLGPRENENLDHVMPNNEKDNLTVLIAYNSVGHISPPCVVFPYTKPPQDVVNSVPQEWCLGKSETGKMTRNVFFEYVTNQLINWTEQRIRKPLLLLVDGRKSLMSLMLSTACEQMGIILYALPPNTANILPSADESVFSPIKAHWNSTVSDVLSRPENIDSEVTKLNFCIFLSEMLDHPNMLAYIMDGFERFQHFPFSINPFRKYVKNTPEERERIRYISFDDIKSFRKVLKCLKPELYKRNINCQLISIEVRALKDIIFGNLTMNQLREHETDVESEVSTSEHNFLEDETTETANSSTYDEDQKAEDIDSTVNE